MEKTQLMINNTIEKGRLALERLKASSQLGYETNLELLLKLIYENRDTKYGKRYGFKDIHSYEEYAQRLPLTEYADYENYIEEIEGGERNVLSSRDTIHFALSSGSSGRPKRVPMCQEAASLFALYTHGACFAVMDSVLGDTWKKGRGVSLTEIRFKTASNGFTYGAVSGKVREKNKAYENDVYTSPLCVSYPKYDMDFMYLHLRFALMEKDLSYITCTFMTAAYDIMRYLERNWKMLTEDIKNGTISENVNVPEDVRCELLKEIAPMPQRAEELKNEFEKGFCAIMPRIWKDLKFIFGIGSESFRIYTERMRYFLGDIKVHYSVFSASEGIFGCPVEAESDEMVLIPYSVFFEFRKMDGSGEIVTMDKVEKGKRYELIVTNLSGFYRYRMMDVIEVTDFFGKLPKVRFIYRLNQVLNIAGEKTNDSTMKDVMGIFEEKTGVKIKEYTLCADTNSSPGRYVVFAEYENDVSPYEAEGMSGIIEEILCRLNSSYGEKIRLGKLGSLIMVPLKKGTYQQYVELMKKKGVSVNQLKPVRVADSDEKKEFFARRRAIKGENIFI